jgi:excisionase family DNA binding protein
MGSTCIHREEYLTFDEVAALLKLSKKTIQNKMAAGIFRKGVHYFKPTGMTPRFKRRALVEWLENTEKLATECDQESIPMARGYVMRISSKK